MSDDKKKSDKKAIQPLKIGPAAFAGATTKINELVVAANATSHLGHLKAEKPVKVTSPAVSEFVTSR